MTSWAAIFGVVLASVLSANLGHAMTTPNDEQARALAIEVVSKATGTPKSELNTKRLEDLEDDLFAAQVKIRGQIKKGAYFYRVENGGYQITPDEVTYRPHSAQSWYVAVSTTDGESFGLYGFKDADAGFQRLISKIPIEVLNTSQAQAFAKFYLEAVYQTRASIVYDKLRLKHSVEEHFVGYTGSQESMSKKEQRFRQWWNAFEAKKVEPLGPSAKAEGNDHYRVTVKVLEMTIGRSPELWEWSLEVQKDGAARLASKRKILPTSARQIVVGPSSNNCSTRLAIFLFAIPRSPSQKEPKQPGGCSRIFPAMYNPPPNLTPQATRP